MIQSIKSTKRKHEMTTTTKELAIGLAEKVVFLALFTVLFVYIGALFYVQVIK